MDETGINVHAKKHNNYCDILHITAELVNTCRSIKNLTTFTHSLVNGLYKITTEFIKLVL